MDLRDPAEIAEAVALCSSVFAGIHLSDISAPRCFEVQRLLDERLDIPVFHDDQQGTAAAVLAALINGLAVAGKTLADATVVVAGLGPGGQAAVRLLVAAGAGSVIACDSKGAVHVGRGDLDGDLSWLAAQHQRRRALGRRPARCSKGADAFIGMSTPGLLSAADDRARWPPTRSCSPWRCPSPRSSPRRPPAWPASTPRAAPTCPNQINSGLASPGIWRGALDCRATEINQAMTLAAANAIAETAAEEARPLGVQRGALDLQPAPGAQRGRRRARRRRGHRGRAPDGGRAAA